VGFFEPTVMFFGMMNLPATFQVIINEILRDLINEGKVTAFVDDILVGTETEEGYDKIVKKILKRLEENNLYIKPEKYMKSMKNRVLRCCYRTKQNRNEEGKGRRSVKLARAKECKRCQEIFRPRKLLQEVYQRFHSSS